MFSVSTILIKSLAYIFVSFLIKTLCFADCKNAYKKLVLKRLSAIKKKKNHH